jgi:hydrogenase-4 component F
MFEIHAGVWVLITLFTPVLIPLLAAIIGFLVFRNWKWVQGWSTLVGSFSSLVASIFLAISMAAHIKERVEIGPVLLVDALSLLFILIINIVALFASVFTLPRPNVAYAMVKPLYGDYNSNLFHPLFNFFHFTMLFVPMQNNLIALWIGIELTTVASTFLVRHRADREASEAAWKFLIISSTGVIFALLGTILLSVAVQSSANSDVDLSWSNLLELAKNGNSNSDTKKLLLAAFFLILIGYGTKAGLAPMHTWIPDGHGEAPPPISALLSGVMLKTAFYAILRISILVRVELQDIGVTLVNNSFLIAGLISLLVATPLIVKRNRKFKRILGYHSVHHMGIIAFGIGLGQPLAVFGALLHCLNHAVTKALLFLAYGEAQTTIWLQDRKKETDFAEGFRGLWHRNRFIGTVLLLGGLALVGTPFTNIFLTEFLILWGGIERATTNLDLLTILGLVIYLATLVVIFGGLVSHLTRLLLADNSPAQSLEKVEPDEKLNSLGRLQNYSLGFMIILIILFGLGIPLGLPVIVEEGANIVLKR